MHPTLPDRYNSCGAPQEYTNEEIDRELYEGEPAGSSPSAFDFQCKKLKRASLPLPSSDMKEQQHARDQHLQLQ